MTKFFVYVRIQVIYFSAKFLFIQWFVDFAMLMKNTLIQCLPSAFGSVVNWRLRQMFKDISVQYEIYSYFIYRFRILPLTHDTKAVHSFIIPCLERFSVDNLSAQVVTIYLLQRWAFYLSSRKKKNVTAPL